jgi:hypothetical protein
MHAASSRQLTDSVLVGVTLALAVISVTAIRGRIFSHMQPFCE